MSARAVACRQRVVRRTRGCGPVRDRGPRAVRGPGPSLLDVRVVSLQRLHEVFTDLHRRVERTHRALEHHRDVFPAEFPDAFLVEVQDLDRFVVRWVIPNPASEETRVGDGVEHRRGEHRLARAALADDTDDFAATDVQRNVVEHVGFALVVGHRGATHLDNWILDSRARSEGCYSASPLDSHHELSVIIFLCSRFGLAGESSPNSGSECAVAFPGACERIDAEKRDGPVDQTGDPEGRNGIAPERDSAGCPYCKNGPRSPFETESHTQFLSLHSYSNCGLSHQARGNGCRASVN